MKVLHVTKTRAGGAGIAAARTVAALRAAGVDATLWTEDAPGLGPRSGSWRRWVLDKLDAVPNRLHWRARRFASWSNNWRRTDLAATINAAAPDIVHLHWVAQGFLSLDDMARIHAPVLWTMHDPWPFTGGCHYPGDCRGYETGCGACPQLGSDAPNDLSARNRRRKAGALPRVRRWIAPSAWIANCAVASGIVPRERVRVVANPLDLDTWAPRPRMEARRALGVPDDALILVGGAMNLREPRKGCALLAPMLDEFSHRTDHRVVLFLFGDGRLAPGTAGNVAVRYCGRIGSESELTRLYSAADAVLLPSLQDNLPNVAVEAQACGCPVIGFDSGGLPEIVADRVTGRIAGERTAPALAAALVEWCAAAPSREQVVASCRQRLAARFAPGVCAAALLAEYRSVLSEPRSQRVQPAT